MGECVGSLGFACSVGVPVPTPPCCCSNTMRMASGMGQKLGVSIHNCGTFVGGVIVGFYYNWKLTLVIFAFMPILVVAGGLMKVRCRRRPASSVFCMPNVWM